MKTILLVDDDDELRAMLRQALTGLGYAVREVRDGAQAIQVCDVELPELMLTDLVMPGIEGIETIIALRRKYPGLRIVAMSGNTLWEPAQMLQVARAMGARAVLEKPFTMLDLERAIATAFGESASPPPARP